MVSCVALGAVVARAEEPTEATPPPAEPSIDPEEDADDNEVVVTGTRTLEERDRAAVRVDVITRRMAEERGATNVAGALASELTTDVSASGYGSLGSPAGAKIGGLDAERVLILVDGERLGGNVGGVLDLSELSLAGIDRIEIVEGPVSALYGTSGLGGVINIITGPPEQEGVSGRARLEGRYRWGGLASGAFAFREGIAWIALDASLSHQDGITREDRPDTLVPLTTRASATVRGGVSPIPEMDLAATFRWSRESSVGLLSQDVPGLGRYFLDVPEDSDRFTVRLEEHSKIGVAKIDVSLSKQWFNLDSVKDRRESPIDESRNRFYTQHAMELRGSFFEGEVASFLIGARAEVESFDQTLVRTTVTTPTETITEIVPTTLGQGSLYGQFRVDPAEEFTGFIGGRLEASPTYGVAGAPRLGVRVTPHETLTLRLSGGRGYRVPSAREVGFAFDHSFFGYRVDGNRDLVPETSWGGVFDASFAPVKGLSLRASAFVNHIQDLIDIAFERSDAGGVDVYTYQNIGSALTAGGDARLEVKATPWARVDFGYAYLFARDLETELPLSGRPAHTVKTSLRLSMPLGFLLNGTARIVSRAYIDEGIIAPPYGTLDLRLAKTLWSKAEAYVGGTNVLGVQKDPASPGDQRPLEGRTIYLGVSADFPLEEEP